MSEYDSSDDESYHQSHKSTCDLTEENSTEDTGSRGSNSEQDTQSIPHIGLLCIAEVDQLRPVRNGKLLRVSDHVIDDGCERIAI
ncbi:hypothetical protein BWQ96_00690 [Gracilariopsis chorda]|uniref:Uncharacterized protein n=1 Tax=Gracilariopsis chorda TaxID=448386 RepID=A0A2V3J4R5_9FLOR|nr:hypothetical protein BWQ96_00690 [Gracilariopsis chorda]|eukprot:PXF49374.1 hypothetical protein BWQ96_00690 [Gracilariopsis chorda]